MTFIGKYTVTEWTAYTPTWGCTGGSTTLGNGTLNGAWRRLGGDTIEILIVLGWGSTTSATGTSFHFTLPAGFTIDYDKVPDHVVDGDFRVFGGTAFTLDNGTPTNHRTGMPVSDDSGAVLPSTDLVSTFIAGAAGALPNPSIPQTWTTDDRLHINAIIPVNE